MTTWNEIIEADPRIGQLADAAERVVATGDEHRDYPDAVYTEAKRYLSVLVGRVRGQEVARGRDGRWAGEHAFADIVTRPAPMTDDRTETMLGSSQAYEVVCTRIYDRLCELYDRRHRWSM